MRFLALVAAALLAAGCGPSPLLNHADAGEMPAAKGGNGESTGESGDYAAGPQVALKKAGVRGLIQWTQGPKTRVESVFEVQFVDASGAPVELPVALEVELWMPSMGHGSAPVVIERLASKPGAYKVRSVHFIMGGDWDIRFRLVNAGQIVDEAVLSLVL